MDKSKIRNQKGAAVTGLVLALFVFIMLMGFFTFDSSRIQMAQRELTATCDAASLAGTAMLTSYQIDNDDAADTKLRNAQTNAVMYAANMFRAGNLLGQPLTSASTWANITYDDTRVTGAPGTTKFMVSLADPLDNYKAVSPQSPGCRKGRSVMVYAGYTYQPVFLSIVGVGTVGLNAYSGGGLPQVDAVLVFDYSGSMDDATMVTFVRTVWDPTQNNSSNMRDYYPNPPTDPQGINGTLNKGLVHYIEIPPPNSGGDSHRLSRYLDFNYANNPNGSSVNVLPPMRMQITDSNDSLANPRYIFDTNLRINTMPYTTTVVNRTNANYNQNWNRDYYSPPGNCTLAANSNPNSYPSGYGKMFTFKLDAPKQSLNAINNSNRVLAYCPDYCPTTGLQPYICNDSTFPERPNQAGPAGYVAHDKTQVNQIRYYTDIVVNIGNPVTGAWPYNNGNIMNGPDTFVDTGDYTFPSEEPDASLRNQTFRFNNLGVLVAAARGNLDNSTYFNSANLGLGSVYTAYGSATQSTGMTAAKCNSRYSRAYTRLAMLYSQPISTALDGADGGFFQKISALTDCRFGFVGFSNSSVMSSPPSANFTTQGSAHVNNDGSLTNSCYISTRYTGNRNIRHRYLGGDVPADNTTNVGGGDSGWRQPRRELVKNEGATAPITESQKSLAAVAGCRSWTALNKVAGVAAAWSTFNGQANGLDNGRPLDNTDTYEAMSTARKMFQNGAKYDIMTIANNRPAAKHAIVFFSDGVPTGGVGGAEASGALAEAANCKGQGIAIYGIGLDVTNNPSLQGSQITFMGNSGGLSDKAGNGGRFFQCTDSSQVKDAFSAVARRLSQGQR